WPRRLAHGVRQRAHRRAHPRDSRLERPGPRARGLRARAPGGGGERRARGAFVAAARGDRIAPHAAPGHLRVPELLARARAARGRAAHERRGQHRPPRVALPKPGTRAAGRHRHRAARPLRNELRALLAALAAGGLLLGGVAAAAAAARPAALAAARALTAAARGTGAV